MIAALKTKLGVKRSELTKDDGFTLIELLVVILIIVVLAAIAIPVFLGQQAQAADAAAKANLANGKIAYTAYLVNTPAGTTTAPADLVNLGFPQSGVTVDVGGSSFCLETSTAPAWHIDYNDAAATTGACP